MKIKKTRLTTFFVALLMLSIATTIALNDDNFAMAIACVIVPVIIGVLVKTKGDPWMKDFGAGLLDASLVLLALVILFFIYSLATWKMDRLF